MTFLPFRQVDVFTTVPFRGNPVAVVLRADGLTAPQMQQIARWTNLSETTFVLPPRSPEASYRVRIFTPAAELPFAGHPTIGTAHALLEAGLVQAAGGVLVQECGIGRVRLEVAHDAARGERRISFELPPPAITPLVGEEVDELEALLGTPLLRAALPCRVDVGPRWVVCQLPDAAAVLAARPDLAALKQLDAAAGNTGVVIFGEHAAGAPARIEVRAFAPAHGIDEDPVCGSGNGCVAAFIRHSGQLARFGREFVASQGGAVGRAGVVRLAVDEGRVRVGGAAVTCIEGRLSPPAA